MVPELACMQSRCETRTNHSREMSAATELDPFPAKWVDVYPPPPVDARSMRCTAADDLDLLVDRDEASSSALPPAMNPPPVMNPDLRSSAHDL